MGIVHLTDSNFEKEVLKCDLPFLVDFWADWCGPCKKVAPVIEELAKEFSQKIKVGKANVDENSTIASRFGIMSIPTLMFFKKGKVMEQAVGVLSKAELKKKIEANI